MEVYVKYSLCMALLVFSLWKDKSNTHTGHIKPITAFQPFSQKYRTNTEIFYSVQLFLRLTHPTK